MNYDDIDGLRESVYFEAKKAEGGLPESIYETVAAFANTVGGVIALGVEELDEGRLRLCGVEHPYRMRREAYRGIAKQVCGVRISLEDIIVVKYKGLYAVEINVPALKKGFAYINGDPVGGRFVREDSFDMLYRGPGA